MYSNELKCDIRAETSLTLLVRGGGRGVEGQVAACLGLAGVVGAL